MEAALAAPFTGQLEEFHYTLEQNGRAGQAEEISQLLCYVKSIQDDLAEAVEEVGFLREQIEAMEKGTMKARLGRMQEEVQRGISQAVVQMKMVEAEVLGGITNVMASLKEKGIRALDGVVNAAHIYQGLDRAESFLAQAMEGVEQKMKAVDSMAAEFHAIKGHAHNIGRAALGYSLEEITPRDPDQGLLSKIRSGMEYCRKILAGLGRKVRTAKAHVGHLHQMAGAKAGEHPVPLEGTVKDFADASARDFGRKTEQAR